MLSLLATQSSISLMIVFPFRDKWFYDELLKLVLVFTFQKTSQECETALTSQIDSLGSYWTQWRGGVIYFGGIMFMIIVSSLISYFNLHPFSTRISFSDNTMRYYDIWYIIYIFPYHSLPTRQCERSRQWHKSNPYNYFLNPSQTNKTTGCCLFSHLLR